MKHYKRHSVVLAIFQNQKVCTSSQCKKIRLLKCASYILVLSLCLSTYFHATQAIQVFSAKPWRECVKALVDEAGNKINDKAKKTMLKMVPENRLDPERPFSKNRTSAKYTPKSEKIGYESAFNILAFKLMTKNSVSRATAMKLIKSRLPPMCTKPELTCDPDYEYRSIDGSCNNLEQEYWGASYEEYERLSVAQYQDGINEPRGGRNVSSLPNPRVISTTIRKDVLHPDPNITQMVAQFGNFLFHDLSLTPESDKRCCTTEPNDPECWPIKIPKNDSLYSKLSTPITCMDFTRSTPYCFPSKTDDREQFNIQTSFVDASHIYGAENATMKLLRAFRGGGRLYAPHSASKLIPTVEDIEKFKRVKIPFMGKYFGGDERTNEIPGVTSFHILFFREHNRISSTIQSRRHDWPGEKIFEEARSILIAEWQSIVYGEYLPVVLGPELMKKYHLRTDSDYSTYNHTVNPTVTNEFATAAFRFGHTLSNENIELNRGQFRKGTAEMKPKYFEFTQNDESGWDAHSLLLRSLVSEPAEGYDAHLIEGVTNLIIKDPQNKFGSDLIARNVQRGRDHGIKSYTEYRKVCKLPAINSWSRKPEEIVKGTWDKLKTLYKTPSEIDLYVGGICETPLPGALVGPTFGCLIGMQFERLKFGDRFFFTHHNQTGSLSPAQLTNIRDRKLSDIICENSNVTISAENAFRPASATNHLRHCHDPWRAKISYGLFTDE